MSDNENSENKAPRRRGLTSLTLQWLAEKLRRAEQIKSDLNEGKYQVDSSKVAKAILEGPADGK